jgi:hypothetical protein
MLKKLSILMPPRLDAQGGCPVRPGLRPALNLWHDTIPPLTIHSFELNPEFNLIKHKKSKKKVIKLKKMKNIN